jgi:hypothetical protein
MGRAQIRPSVALNKWRLEVARTPIDVENVNPFLTRWIWVRTGAEKQTFMLEKVMSVPCPTGVCNIPALIIHG